MVMKISILIALFLICIYSILLIIKIKKFIKTICDKEKIPKFNGLLKSLLNVIYCSIIPFVTLLFFNINEEGCLLIMILSGIVGLLAFVILLIIVNKICDEEFNWDFYYFWINTIEIFHYVEISIILIIIFLIINAIFMWVK